MISSFRQWLDSFPEFSSETESRKLIEDAIACYIHDIPRPAIMLSYLAFLQAVRNNIISAERPSGYTEGEWKSRISNLQSDDKWEAELLQCIATQGSNKKAPIFNIPQNLRDDIVYWKNRRNDCAHYKRNIVSSSHVCAFWQFLMSNYIYFQPQGSISKSIREYLDYYDPSVTPPGSDSTLIFKHLCAILREPLDLNSFFAGIKSIENKNKVQILSSLLHHASPQVLDLTKNYLTENNDRAFYYLKSYPSDVSLLFGDNPKIIRSIWFNLTDFQLFLELIKSNLIPQKEKDESITHVLSKLYETNEKPNFVATSETKDLLMKYGIIDVFYAAYFSDSFFDSNYARINYKIGFYSFFLSIIGVSREWVIPYCTRIEEKKAFPYNLDGWIKTQLKENSLNKSDFDAIVSSYGLMSPLEGETNATTDWDSIIEAPGLDD